MCIRDSSLSEFTSPENYKSYDELKAKLNRVLGIDGGDAMESSFVQTAPTSPAPDMATAEPVSEESSEREEEDTLSYFAKLAQEN